MNPREFLARLEFFGIRLGLENITRMLEGTGQPQRAYPTIHIAGTNGKGSVAAFVSAMLRAAGYRVGLYTSPHLIDLNERMVIDGNPISDAALDDSLACFQDLCAPWPVQPTYFETATATAFHAFARAGIDVGVIEVGMGGRFDATNVLDPVVCAITPIDYDHMKYLGDTLEQIAFEKAGIIKPCAPVVIAEEKAGPRKVLLEAAAGRGTQAVAAGRDYHWACRGEAMRPMLEYNGPRVRLDSIELALAGRHQAQNAAAAVATGERLLDRFEALTTAHLIEGLRTARWPCRLERVLQDPPVIVDVAHNPGGIAMLVEAIPHCVAVVAVSADKDARAMLERLAPHAERVVLSQVRMHRGMPLADLQAAADSVGLTYDAVPELKPAIARGIAHARGGCPLVITGSIFTAGEARAILQAEYGAPPLSFG